MSTCSPTNSSDGGLTITRGESKTYQVLVRDAQKAAVDLTGAKVWFTVKARIEDVAVLITKRNAAAGGDASQAEILLPQTGDTKGKFRFYLVPSDTASLDPQKVYVCDVWIELSTGKRYPVIRKRSFRVDPSVTTVFT